MAQLLALPPEEARARAAAVGEARRSQGDSGPPVPVILAILLFGMIFLFTRGRRRSSGLGGALPWIVLGALSNSGRDRDGWGGGGFGGGGGGGGFSGGGGSFGGGGSSGSW
jgi:uncharacterized protein